MTDPFRKINSMTITQMGYALAFVGSVDSELLDDAISSAYEEAAEFSAEEDEREKYHMDEVAAFIVATCKNKYPHLTLDQVLNTCTKLDKLAGDE